MSTMAKNGGAGDVSRGVHLFVGSCSALVLGFVIWAWLMPLDVVSQADGEVIPSTKVKRVQHLEGGIVRKIMVREGDHVKRGQELVELEATASDSSVEELEVRIASLQAETARFEADIKGLESPVFPEELVKDHPEIVAQARELFDARSSRHKSDLAGQEEDIKQKTQTVSEIKARIRNTLHNLSLLREQIAISAELLDEGLTTKYKHLSFLQEESGLVSRVEEDRAALKRSEAALEASRERLEGMEHGFQEESREELTRSQRELDEFTQRLRKFSDSLKRSVIRSPVDGVVKTIYIVNVGEVVRPGVTIMDIVPGGDKLIIEAHLPISDIGYVQVGQKAVVKLASRDSSRFGNLDGEVIQVSPDVVTEEMGTMYRTYYRVLIRTDKSYFEHERDKYRLFPGMQVIAGIHIGKRTVLEYLLEPFFNSFSFSMHER